MSDEPNLQTPWSAEQVDQANAWQACGWFHPYTCGGDRMDEAHRAYQAKHGGDFGQLVATENGWVCPVCDYRQGWAHGFTLNDEPPRNPMEILAEQQNTTNHEEKAVPHR